MRHEDLSGLPFAKKRREKIGIAGIRGALKSERKRRERACMDLWQQIVKLRAGGKCEYCGKTPKKLDAHHFFHRSYARLKYNPDNGFALCYGHHRGYAHRLPQDFIEWAILQRGPEWYERLNLIRRASLAPKIDLDLLLAGLQSELQAAKLSGICKLTK